MKKIKKSIKTLLILYGVILLTGCSYKNAILNNNSIAFTTSTLNEKNFGITLEQFNCSWKLPEDEVILKISDDILNKTMWVSYDMDSLTYESLENFNWNIEYTTAPNTFQLHLQCLNPIVYLTKAYELSKNIDYLNYAKQIIYEWSKFEKSEKSKSNHFVWYDHGTALRAENLIYYCLVADQNKLLSVDEKEFFRNLINTHAKYLASNDFYTENHNHGIFQDRALIYCAYFLSSTDTNNYLNLAKKRLKSQKEYAFTEEMVHVENSPGYQIGVMDLFRIISEFLIQFDDDYANELYNDIVQSAEFMAYMIKPNGLVAEIGDTNSLLRDSSVSNEKLSIFQNEHLTYASSLGEKGEKPIENSVFYPKSGYYISHNNWEKENYNLSTWQMFKSGYSSRTHKHADDNSFMLYSKGFDIFVDPGWYNYMIGDKYRDYFISSLAHNTVVVDEKTYSPTAENSSKTGIYTYEKNEFYDYILGYNDMYSGVNFDRHYYNFGDAILIYDNILSEEIHTYTQLFHTSEVMDIISQTGDETILKLADTGYYVRIKQLLNHGINSFITGEDNSTFGHISRKMGHLDQINTIKYDIKGNNVDFLTLISIEDESGQIQDIQSIVYQEDESILSIVKNTNEKFSIELNARKRISPKQVTRKQLNDNTFLFTNENRGGYYYAWYIIDKKNAQVIFKSDYSDNNTLKYSFKNKGEYLVKAYTRSIEHPLRRSAIIADINYDLTTHKYIDVTSNTPYLNLTYHGHKLQQISDHIYSFTVNYDYSWSSSIKWYIYRNGGYYTTFTTQNENNITYEFNEPGSYTVMYYLTTPNGENEFWNFKELIIN